LSFTKRYTSS